VQKFDGGRPQCRLDLAVIVNGIDVMRGIDQPHKTEYSLQPVLESLSNGLYQQGENGVLNLIRFKPHLDCSQLIVFFALFVYTDPDKFLVDNNAGRVDAHAVQRLQNRIIQMILESMQMLDEYIGRLLFSSKSQRLGNAASNGRLLCRVGKP